jgi:hemolysin activation/secretion protein
MSLSVPNPKRQLPATPTVSLTTSLAVALFASLAGAEPVHSQSAAPGLPTQSFPAPIQQPLPTLPEAPNPTPLQPGLPAPTRPTAPVGPSPDAGQGKQTRIPVCGFRFVGNTVFRNQELETAIIDAYFEQKITPERLHSLRDLNQPLSFSELNLASQAISKLYIKMGYETSGAYIPKSQDDGCEVEIRILEGRLGNVDVEVKKGPLNKRYVESRVRRTNGGVLNLKRLKEELGLLQVNPLIRTLQATLTASSSPARSDLKITVTSAPRFKSVAAMDNGRNPQVGSFRRGVDLLATNITGYGDGFALAYRNTDGSNDLQMSYELPLTSSDLTLTLLNRNLYSWIIQEPLNQLNINSHYQQWLVRLRQPLLQRVDQTFALGLSLNKQDNKGLFLDDLPFPGRGVDPNGESRVSTLSFSQDWTLRSTRQVMSISSEISLGLDGLDTTTPADYPYDPNSPDASFFYWRADGQFVRLLDENMLLVARLRSQIADGPLPSVEQFGLGGLGSVQGYQTNSLLTDSGLFGSLEVALPIVSWQKGMGVLQVVPFTAVGYGWNGGPAPQPDVNLLGSVGMGLQLRIGDNLGDNLNVRLDYAQRLGRTPYSVSDMWQDQALLFTVRYVR